MNTIEYCHIGSYPCVGINLYWQIIFWAFVYNVVCIPLAAGALYGVTDFQITPMWASALMAMSSVSVVLNSLRLKAAA